MKSYIEVTNGYGIKFSVRKDQVLLVEDTNVKGVVTHEKFTTPSRIYLIADPHHPHRVCESRKNIIEQLES